MGMLQFIPLVCQCRLPHTIVDMVFHPSSSAEFFWFRAQTISFLFWPVVAILYRTVEILIKNSLLEKKTLLAAESMTCSSSPNIPLLTSIRIEMSLIDQEICHDPFNSTVQPLQQKLVTPQTNLTAQTSKNETSQPR